MASSKEPAREKTLEQLVEDVGLYPPEAYEFVQQGLKFTVERAHAEEIQGKISRHVTGQQLCEGLRDLALKQWGFLAGMVLRRWNITGTLDFGRIVFALIEIGQMQRNDDDLITDFKNVYDFKSTFDSGYEISTAS